nr:hypothetical protein GCM10020092_039190 [Actinoplanes digitatis]
MERIVEKCLVTTAAPPPPLADLSSVVWIVRTTASPDRISGPTLIRSRSPAASTDRVCTGPPSEGPTADGPPLAAGRPPVFSGVAGSSVHPPTASITSPAVVAATIRRT